MFDELRLEDPGASLAKELEVDKDMTLDDNGAAKANLVAHIAVVKKQPSKHEITIALYEPTQRTIKVEKCRSFST